MSEISAPITTRHPIKDEVILRFDAATIRTLIEHSINAPAQMSMFGQKVSEPSLLFVIDAGIYLMSNGTPRIDSTGNVHTNPDKGFSSLCAYALGCESKEKNYEHIRSLQVRLSDGSDLSLFLETEIFVEALQYAQLQIIMRIRISDEDFFIELFPDRAE